MADLGKGGGEVWRVAAVHISQFQWGKAFGVGYGEGVEQHGGTEDWVDSRGGDSGGVWGFGYDLRLWEGRLESVEKTGFDFSSKRQRVLHSCLLFIVLQ